MPKTRERLPCGGCGEVRVLNVHNACAECAPPCPCPDCVEDSLELDEEGCLTDGVHRFWRCPRTGGVKWARVAWPDDGVGVSNHGRAVNLRAAIKAAKKKERERNDTRD